MAEIFSFAFPYSEATDVIIRLSKIGKIFLENNHLQLRGVYNQESSFRRVIFTSASPCVYTKAFQFERVKHFMVSPKDLNFEKLSNHVNQSKGFIDITMGDLFFDYFSQNSYLTDNQRMVIE